MIILKSLAVWGLAYIVIESEAFAPKTIAFFVIAGLTAPFFFIWEIFNGKKKKRHYGKLGVENKYVPLYMYLGCYEDDIFIPAQAKKEKDHELFFPIEPVYTVALVGKDHFFLCKVDESVYSEPESHDWTKTKVWEQVDKKIMAIPFNSLKQAVSVDKDEKKCADEKWNASLNDFLWNKTIGLLRNRNRSTIVIRSYILVLLENLPDNKPFQRTLLFGVPEQYAKKSVMPLVEPFLPEVMGYAVTIQGIVSDFKDLNRVESLGCLNARMAAELLQSFSKKKNIYKLPKK